MKGILATDKGVLFKHSELIKILGLPEDVLLTRFENTNKHVVVYYIKNRHFEVNKEYEQVDTKRYLKIYDFAEFKDLLGLENNYFNLQTLTKTDQEGQFLRDFSFSDTVLGLYYTKNVLYSFIEDKKYDDWHILTFSKFDY